MANTYNIYRDGVLIGTSPTPTYTDYAPGGSHTYQVSAVSANGEGPKATVASVSVPTSLAWNGSAWIDMVNAEVWDGTQWIAWSKAKAWDGTKWVAV